MKKLLNLIANFLKRRGRSGKILNGKGNSFRRFYLLWKDEWIGDGWRIDGHPWWFPFNVFLHKWGPQLPSRAHNHPRWTLTIVLSGKLIETTNRLKTCFLTPGSIVLRNPKDFHQIMLAENCEEAWTLFFVGRRKFAQSYLEADGSITPMYKTGGMEDGVSGESLIPYLDVTTKKKRGKK